MTIGTRGLGLLEHGAAERWKRRPLRTCHQVLLIQFRAPCQRDSQQNLSTGRNLPHFCQCRTVNSCCLVRTWISIIRNEVRWNEAVELPVKVHRYIEGLEHGIRPMQVGG
jgi:hypothetical protein